VVPTLRLSISDTRTFGQKISLRQDQSIKTVSDMNLGVHGQDHVALAEFAAGEGRPADQHVVDLHITLQGQYRGTSLTRPPPPVGSP